MYHRSGQNHYDVGWGLPGFFNHHLWRLVSYSRNGKILSRPDSVGTKIACAWKGEIGNIVHLHCQRYRWYMALASYSPSTSGSEINFTKFVGEMTRGKRRCTKQPLLKKLGEKLSFTELVATSNRSAIYSVPLPYKVEKKQWNPFVFGHFFGFFQFTPFVTIGSCSPLYMDLGLDDPRKFMRLWDVLCLPRDDASSCSGSSDQLRW